MKDGVDLLDALRKTGDDPKVVVELVRGLQTAREQGLRLLPSPMFIREQRERLTATVEPESQYEFRSLLLEYELSFWTDWLCLQSMIEDGTISETGAFIVACVADDLREKHLRFDEHMEMVVAS